VDLLLAALAAATLLGVFAQAVPSAGMKVPSWAASPWIGLIALLLVVVTLVNHPPAAVGRDLDTGVWVGLAGAILMAIGGMLGFGRVSLVITRRERRYRRPPPTGPVDQEHPPTESLGYEERPGAFPETDILDEDDR
jgi:peptidoglycan/LPS O-acetylase OafA/YrhL